MRNRKSGSASMRSSARWIARVEGAARAAGSVEATAACRGPRRSPDAGRRGAPGACRIFARARVFVARARRLADEHARRLGESPAPLDVVGTADRDALDRRIAVVQLVDGAIEAGLRPAAARLPARSCVSRNDTPTRRGPGLDRNADLEAVVGLVHVLLPLGIRHDVAGKGGRRRLAPGFAADREQLQPASIEPHLERVRPSDADDVVVELPLQPDLDDVLAVDREASGAPRCRRAIRTADPRSARSSCVSSFGVSIGLERPARSSESPTARRLIPSPPTCSARAAPATPTARRRCCRIRADPHRRPAAARAASISSASRSRIALAYSARFRRCMDDAARDWDAPPRRDRVADSNQVVRRA